jgi:nitroreductase
MTSLEAILNTTYCTLYKKAYYEYYLPRRPQQAQDPRFFASGVYLVERLHEVPVHIIPCKEESVEHDTSPFWQATSYGGILPAAWSLMLALRSRGLGSAWTTLHLLYKEEVATLLGIPQHFTQAALLPVAYFTGTDFKPAKRVPGRERTYWDTWGETR